MIDFNSNRKFYIEKYVGIYFNNYKINDFTLNHLLGEHPEYINARKMIREKRKDWTNEDYMNLLKQGTGNIKKIKSKVIENQVKMEV